jgi:hypothetical protein
MVDRHSTATVTAEDHFMPQGAVAELLGVSERSLESWRQQGFGPPYYRFGRRCLYRRSLVLSWAEAQRRNCTSDCGESAA